MKIILHQINIILILSHQHKSIMMLQKGSLSFLNISYSILLIFSLFLNVQTKVSYQNVKEFFKHTYDLNDDQQVTWKQFTGYFKRLQPDHQFAFDVLNSAFNAFDSDKNGVITLQQLISLDQVEIKYKPGHKQIHLGFTENQHQMQVMWVSTPQSYDQPAVFYGQYPTKLNQLSHATTTTYNAGHYGFHGRIYRAVMKNLLPGRRYYYKVGDIKSQTFSQIKYFKSPPKWNTTLDQIKFAVFGDMGTYAPFGHMVNKMVASYNMERAYDFVFLTGDIAYAGVSSQQKGQIQPIWDLFGQQSQKYAAYTAFMAGVGNHDNYYNSTAYTHRYRLPKKQQNQSNMYFSFDYGQLHITYFSSEQSFVKGSQQYTFLQQDLKKARQNPNTKWIILGAHRPFYSADTRSYEPITNLTKNLQELINLYKVDIMQNGHQHCYQRSWPVYQGKAKKQNQDQKYYVNPTAPIYVVQGTAGALVHNKWVTPPPQWSMKRTMKYGYGQVTIKANYLKYEFITLPIGKVVDTWYIIKDQSNNNTIIQQNLAVNIQIQQK